MNPAGHTFSIKRMQTHDGPGLRTTVFMKGCPLRCTWCHNPESHSGEQELWLDETKCIGCGNCFNDDGERTGHSNWNGDIRAVENCPAKALELLRSSWSADKLLKLIERDAGFFEDGGVTFSGGEPALQAPFVAETMKRCRMNGLHTALDTCGAAPPASFDALLPHCDMILFDLKIMNPEQHRKWTGQDNRTILENFGRITAYAVRHPELRIWLRTPLIPGATDSDENIRAIAGFLEGHRIDQIERWELCAFNNLCTEKYRRLNQDWAFASTPLMDRAHGERLHETARKKLSPEMQKRVHLKGRMR